MTEGREGAQAIHRAMDVLDAFTMQRQSVTAVELARLLELPVPTAHRITTALADRGYLVRDDATREFALGPSVLRLAGIAGSGRRAYSHLAPLLERLREEFGETVGLHVRVGDRRVCVREVESLHRVRVTSGVGQTYPLTAGAASKVFLAHLSDDEVDSLLTDLSPEARRSVRGAIASTRELGYATSHAETIASSAAVAARVPDHSGAPLVTVNVAGPDSRMTPEKLTEIGARLRLILAELDVTTGGAP